MFAPTLRRKPLVVILGGVTALMTLSGAVGVMNNSGENAPLNHTQAVYQPQGGAYAAPNINPQAQGYDNDQAQGYGAPQGGGYDNAQYGNDQNTGYSGGGTGYAGGGTQDYSSVNQATQDTNDAINQGYWDRQRSQDQQAQAFSGYINDTTTVQDTQTGEVHQDVTNDVAYPAIDSGAATQVPTSELPTSYDASASTATTDTSSTSTTGE